MPSFPFSDSVENWRRATVAQVLLVQHKATITFLRSAQDMIPVLSGFARSSVRVSLSSLPQVDPTLYGNKHLTYSWDEENSVWLIQQAELGDTVFIGWRAAYIPDLEMGSSSQAPLGFIRLNAQMWPQFVSEAVRDAKNTPVA